jgi:hypothetical protein
VSFRSLSFSFWRLKRSSGAGSHHPSSTHKPFHQSGLDTCDIATGPSGGSIGYTNNITTPWTPRPSGQSLLAFMVEDSIRPPSKHQSIITCSTTQSVSSPACQIQSDDGERSSTSNRHSTGPCVSAFEPSKQSQFSCAAESVDSWSLHDPNGSWGRLDIDRGSGRGHIVSQYSHRSVSVERRA